LEAYRFVGEGKNAASLKQIRAVLSFAYKHWDLKNPFAKIEPPLHKEPQIRYLLLSDIRRLLAYLKVRQQGYGSALAFHLANALFQTACRFDELIRLTWIDWRLLRQAIEDLLDFIDAELLIHSAALFKLDALDHLRRSATAELPVVIEGPDKIAIEKEDFEVLDALQQSPSQYREENWRAVERTRSTP
jgi:hypothetical protein